MDTKLEREGRRSGKVLPTCLAAVIGFTGFIGFAGCSHRQNTDVARGRACPVALRDAQVTMQEGLDDVRVRVAAPAGGSPEAIASRAEYIAEALSRHTETTIGASDTVRPSPGREVRVQRVGDAIELTFSADSFLAMEVLRRRISDRVLRWQNGDCPTVEGMNMTALGDEKANHFDARVD